MPSLNQFTAERVWLILRVGLWQRISVSSLGGSVRRVRVTFPLKPKVSRTHKLSGMMGLEIPLSNLDRRHRIHQFQVQRWIWVQRRWLRCLPIQRRIQIFPSLSGWKLRFFYGHIYIGKIFYFCKIIININYSLFRNLDIKFRVLCRILTCPLTMERGELQPCFQPFVLTLWYLLSRHARSINPTNKNH